MPKCKNCKNLKNGWCEKITDSPHTDVERECEHYQKMTNADKIRNMTDEELAEFIDYKPFDCSDICKRFGRGCSSNCSSESRKQFYLDLLQSEAE